MCGSGSACGVCKHVGMGCVHFLLHKHQYNRQNVISNVTGLYTSEPAWKKSQHKRSLTSCFCLSSQNISFHLGPAQQFMVTADDSTGELFNCKEHGTA